MIINKNQRMMIIGLILVLFSLSMIINSSYAAPLTPTNDIKKTIEAASSESVIDLDPDKGEFNLNSQIVISDKSLTIKSSSSSKNAVINLNQQDRAFYISDTGRLTLINITIKNGKAQGDYPLSTLYWRTGGNGGAIYNDGGTLTLTGCTFTSNTAPASISRGGGAIMNKGSATLSACTFTSNTIAGDGGAIGNFDGGTLTLSGCTFTGNTATNGGFGGAVYNYWDSGSVTLSGCTFTSNTAASSGGAIYSDGSLTVSGCTFTNNKATSYNGGAISGSDLTVNSCTFTGNTATSSGGAIYIDGGNSKLTDCVFNKNTANNGGAIYIYSGILTVNGCSFTENLANDKGGAIWNSRTATFTSCSFSKNTAYGFGGAVYNWHIATLISCSFSQNKGVSGDYGGAIFTDWHVVHYPLATTTVNGCNFDSLTPANLKLNKITTSKATIKKGKKIYSKVYNYKNLGKTT